MQVAVLVLRVPLKPFWMLGCLWRCPGVDAVVWPVTCADVRGCVVVERCPGDGRGPSVDQPADQVWTGDRLFRYSLQYLEEEVVRSGRERAGLGLQLCELPSRRAHVAAGACPRACRGRLNVSVAIGGSSLAGFLGPASGAHVGQATVVIVDLDSQAGAVRSVEAHGHERRLPAGLCGQPVVHGGVQRLALTGRVRWKFPSSFPVPVAADEVLKVGFVPAWTMPGGCDRPGGYDEMCHLRAGRVAVAEVMLTVRTYAVDLLAGSPAALAGWLLGGALAVMDSPSIWKVNLPIWW